MGAASPAGLLCFYRKSLNSRSLSEMNSSLCLETNFKIPLQPLLGAEIPGRNRLSPAGMIRGFCPALKPPRQGNPQPWEKQGLKHSPAKPLAGIQQTRCPLRVASPQHMLKHFAPCSRLAAAASPASSTIYFLFARCQRFPGCVLGRYFLSSRGDPAFVKPKRGDAAFPGTAARYLGSPVG